MAPKFSKIQPSLPVTSIPEAINYYQDSLGFRLAGRDGDDHCWLQLVDDESIDIWDAAVNIYLRRTCTSNMPHTLDQNSSNIVLCALLRSGLCRT